MRCITLVSSAIRGLVIATCSFAAVVSSYDNAQASNDDHFIQTGKTTKIPIGHAQYCRSIPSDCKRQRNKSLYVPLTQSVWDAMITINHKANTEVQSISDLALYGREEVWAFPNGAGDCEDYVLLKRDMLIRAGIPSSALLITVVRQENGDGHAVLTVKTGQGDFILDNLNPKVSIWNKTPYTFLKVQSQDHAGKWKRVIDNRFGSTSQTVASTGSPR